MHASTDDPIDSRQWPRAGCESDRTVSIETEQHSGTVRVLDESLTGLAICCDAPLDFQIGQEVTVYVDRRKLYAVVCYREVLDDGHTQRIGLQWGRSSIDRVEMNDILELINSANQESDGK